MNRPVTLHKYTRTFWQLCCHPKLLMQGLAWIGGLGLLGSGMVWAQTQPLEIADQPAAINSLSISEPTAEPQWTPDPSPIAYESVPVPPSEPVPSWTPAPSWESEPSWTPEPVSAASELLPEPVPTASAPAPQPAWEPDPVWTSDSPWEPEISGTSTPVFEASAPAPEPAWTPDPSPIDSESVPAPAGLSAPIDSSAYQLAPLRAEPDYIPTDEAPALTSPTSDRASYSDVYIDPTTYSIGATDSNDLYAQPTEIVVSERSTGCQAVLETGQNPASICSGATPAPEPYSAPVGSRPASNWARSPARRSTPIQTWTPSYRRNPQPAAASASEYDPLNLGKIMNAVGIQLGDTTPIGRDYFNPIRAARPGNGNTAPLFPLSIPAPITSAFGWRTHPIFGDRRFHSGTDIGAAMGTPVVAALAGTVAISDFLGGYGLTVVLEHEKSTRETLYAHLSEVFVKPGDEIKQGTVIGRVGNTGNSTGPHLHFEFRQLTSQGWVTLNPGAQLEYGLARLIESWQTADASPQAQKALHKLEKLRNEAIAPEDMPTVKVRR